MSNLLGCGWIEALLRVIKSEIQEVKCTRYTVPTKENIQTEKGKFVRVGQMIIERSGIYIVSVYETLIHPNTTGTYRVDIIHTKAEQVQPIPDDISANDIASVIPVSDSRSNKAIPCMNGGGTVLMADMGLEKGDRISVWVRINEDTSDDGYPPEIGFGRISLMRLGGL